MQAVHAMHKGWAHRDIKPHNVIVSGWDQPDGPDIVIVDWANAVHHAGKSV